MSASELPPPDLTVGPILVGGAVSFFLYGLTCLQTFIYIERYPRDRISTKSAVLVLWVIDTLDVAFVMQTCYYYMVTNVGNELAIISPTWSLKLHVFVTSLTDFVVRSMFTKRIYAVSHRNLPIALVIAALSLLDLVVGIVITARAWSIDTYQGLTAVATLFDVNFATILVADTFVAVCLSYFLWINRTGSKRADSLVNKLVLYTVTTGFLTVIDSALGTITYHTNPTTLVFIAFYFNLSKLYVNSYLASLNIRKSLLRPMHADNAVSIQLSGATTGPRMPSFRCPESVTGTGEESSTREVSRITTADTLDTGKRSGEAALTVGSCGKRTAGGGSSMMTSTTAVETPTTATQLYNPLLRHESDCLEEKGAEDEDDVKVDVESTGDADVEAAMAEVKDVDVDVYEGDVDPEEAYTRRARRP